MRLMIDDCTMLAFGDTVFGSFNVAARLRQTFGGVQCMVLSLSTNQSQTHIWVQPVVAVKSANGQESGVSLSFQVSSERRLIEAIELVTSVG